MKKRRKKTVKDIWTMIMGAITAVLFFPAIADASQTGCESLVEIGDDLIKAGELPRAAYTYADAAGCYSSEGDVTNASILYKKAAETYKRAADEKTSENDRLGAAALYVLAAEHYEKAGETKSAGEAFKSSAGSWEKIAEGRAENGSKREAAGIYSDIAGYYRQAGDNESAENSLLKAARLKGKQPEDEWSGYYIYIVLALTGLLLLLFYRGLKSERGKK